MPSRIIKESITTSESLSEVSAEAERLFWRLVVKADDFGLYYGNPRILFVRLLDPPKEQRIRAWLDELVAAGMVWTYTSDEDGKKYLKLLSWDRQQQQRAKKQVPPFLLHLITLCNHSNGKQVESKSPVNENENGNRTRNEERNGAQPGRRRPQAVLIASGPHIPAESASRTP